MTPEDTDVIWTKVLSHDELEEGRVKPVTCHHRKLCMTRFEGRYGALDNLCPHQKGPLGEGSIENGLLRCPWHGRDFHPITGEAPGNYGGVATFRVEERADGIDVGMPPETDHVRTLGDLMMETLARSRPETLAGTASFPIQKRGVFVQGQGRSGCTRLVLLYAAQGNPKSDAEIAEKRRFWTGTNPYISSGFVLKRASRGCAQLGSFPPRIVLSLQIRCGSSRTA